MRAIIDTGALVAADKGDRKALALLQSLARADVEVVTSAGVVAQVHRDGARQAALVRVVQGMRVDALDEAAARGIGRLLARDGSSDIVDAHVTLLARHGDVIHTSDPDDLRRLAGSAGVRAKILAV